MAPRQIDKLRTQEALDKLGRQRLCEVSARGYLTEEMLNEHCPVFQVANTLRAKVNASLFQADFPVKLLLAVGQSNLD